VSSVAGAGSTPHSARLPASTWLAVGILGVLLFGVGVWEPAWAGIRGGPYLEVAMAVAGGCLLMVGFTYYSRSRPSYRRVRLEDLADGKTVTLLDFRPTGSPPRKEATPLREPSPPSDREVRP